MKSIGFGFERVAWPALFWPRVTLAAFAGLIAVAGVGASRLSFDENLRNVFANDSVSFDDYKTTTDQFVDPENETLVLIEGATLSSPANFQRLQDLQLELQLVDGVDSVYSLFALRDPPDPEGNAPLLVSDAAAGLTPELVDRIRSHPILGSKLLSADGKAMVFVVTPSEHKAPLSLARKVNARVTALAGEVLKDSGLSVNLTGFPVIRSDIVDILKRDQLILNGIGAVIGFIISLIVFRSLIAAVLTAVPAILGALVVVGGMGLLGTPVTVMSNVVPALVMILGYADGMHLSHAWRRFRDEGHTPIEAERHAQAEVAPACMLTAITVALAFASLGISDTPIVRNFAWTGAIAMMAGCAIVLVGHALLAIFVGHFWTVNRGRPQDLLARLTGPSAAISRFAVDNARVVGLLSMVLFLVLGAMYISVPPNHSIREHLPTNNAANAALGRVDQLFGGAFPLQIVVPLNGLAPTDPAALEKLGAVHEAVAKIDGVGTPLSAWSLVQWLGGNDDATTVAKLDEIMTELTPSTRSRFFGRTGAALVSATLHEAPTYVMAPILAEIERAAKAAGGSEVSVTGVSVVTTRESNRAIGTLSWSLTLAVFGDIFIMVVAFRNLPIGIVSVIANTIPIFATGSLLFFLGRGMQFTSVIALTVAFGIAVDDTIHYLNRFLIGSQGKASLRDRLIDTARHIGPVLIGSTAIIIAGLSTTLTSGLPTISLFGELVAITLIAAILGDLVVMPALIAGYGRRWFEKKRKEPRRADEVSASASP